MKEAVKITWALAGIIALHLGFLAFKNSGEKLAIQTQDISAFVNLLGKESETYFETTKDISFEDDNEFASKLKKKKWYLLKYNSTTPTYWNSNKISLDSTVLNNSTFPKLYVYGDDAYAVFKKDKSYLAFRLANDGVLHPRLVKAYPNLKNYGMVYNMDNNETLTQRFSYKSAVSSQTIFEGVLLASLLLILFLLYYKQRDLKYTIPVGLLLLLNLISYWLSGMEAHNYLLLNSEAFTLLSPEALIGITLLHLFTLFALFILLLEALKLLPERFSVILISAGLFFITDLIIDLAHRFAYDSSISFNFEKLFDLNYLSFIGVAVIVLLFVLLITLVYSSKIWGKALEHWWAIFIGAAFFGLFQFFDAGRSISSLSLPIFITLVIISVYLYLKSPKIQIYSLFVVISIIVSSILFSGKQNRERLEVKQLATELLTNRDASAENILKSVENQLAFEFLTPLDYTDFQKRKDLIESRIKQLYFSNYLEKYELKLLSFNPEGVNTNQNDIFTFSDLDSLFNNNTTRTSSDYFYRIKDPKNFNGYIAKYENCDIEGHYGTTFLLLQPRVVQSEFLYPQAFANQAEEEGTINSDYSYGVYFKQKLINQSGTYPYELNKLPAPKQHYLYTNNEYTIAINKANNRFRSWLSSFTFTLVIMLPLSFLLSLLSKLILANGHSLSTAFVPWSSKFLSSRIQTSLTVILLAALLLSVYFIINYITANYNTNLENELLTKVKNISTQVQNKVDLKRKLGDQEQRTLILNDESSTYKVDINLFDVDGGLLGSTKPYLYEEEILSRNINPKAYKKLVVNSTSQLLIQEELEGSSYLSAYVPLFDGKSEVIGYLNTPYFAKNEALNKQLSSLVVNVLNIYFLLIILGIVTAIIIGRQISKPLLIIQDKIAHTELGVKNELITYDRDDEIGQLVKQYNKMVLELEESANQLAESERDEAWREMAKQVAHEIKNPLTPMKLSIQHLQRAYTQGPSEKLDGLFGKTSKLLIDQINSLSTMASEFSNFAKMPDDRFEEFNLSTTLSDTVELFKRSENINIESAIEPNVMVKADQDQIKRVFNNLIKNAIQAIPDSKKGLIHVALKAENGEAIVNVKDNGSGIPKALFKKVFVPNFSTKNSGMGLGLAISKKSIDQANGNISFVSEENKGTTFEVRLPRV